MTLLDGIILALVIAVLLIIGLSGKSKQASTEDYFLAGRNLRWWQIGFSLFATNFSASAIIGLTGAAYITGIAIYNYEWVGVLAMIFFAIVLVGAVRNSGVYTIAQYLEERYDNRIKTAYSVFIIFLIIFIDMAGSLYAGGLLLREVFPDIPLNVIILGIMVLAGLYSVMGGLKAISRTDILQSSILIVGAVLVSWFTLRAAGGWQQMVTDTPKGSLSLIRPLDDRAVPWSGLIIGIPILCAYFWLVNQNMVQWVLSAKSAGEARKGLLMAGYMKLLVLLIIIIPGVAAVKLFPGLPEADRIYPTLLFELLPAGVLGLVLAGFVSALMANTDSTLHAASTIVTMDFVKKYRPGLDERKLVQVGRMTTLLIIGFSAIWAPMIGNFGTLFEYVQGLLSYAVAPFVVAYLAGWFWPGATAKGVWAALLCGLTTALFIAGLQATNLLNIHYLHVPLPVATISLIAMLVFNRPDIGQKIYAGFPSKNMTPLSKKDWMVTMLLLFLLSLQIIVFR